MQRLATLGIATIFILSALSFAQEYNPSEARLEVMKISDTIYKLQCISGTFVNTLASVGEDGVLLVDTGYPQTGDILKREIEKLGHGKVRFVLNTHEHDDHLGGNDRFGDEAVIISHERVRRTYGGGYFALAPIDRTGIPEVVFDDALTIFFNGEEIRLRHYPGGHTLGDVIVHFTRSKIAFVGDMVFAGCFPGADIARGGNLDICLDNVQKIIDDYPDDMRYICGHGPDYSKEELRRYLAVGRETKKLIEEEIEKGKAIEAIVESGLLDDWREWSEGVISNEDWVTCVYQQRLKETGALKPSICQPLTEAIKEGEMEEVVRLYERLRRDEADAYDFEEGQLNQLGYLLLNRNMVKEAIAVLELNVKAYPESGNVYDSLAEAYMNDGNEDLAITFYLKSLEKDPGNENARGMLKRLGHEE